MSFISGKCNTRVNMRKRQSGYVALLGILLALSIASGLAVIQLKADIAKNFSQKASEGGQELRTYNAAVMKLISNLGPNITSIFNTPTDTTATFTGSSWLKPISCGGTASANDDYLNCDFDDNNVFGQSYTTVVTFNTASGRVTAITRLSALSNNSGLRRRQGEILGVLRKTAAGAITRNDPTVGVFSDYELEQVSTGSGNFNVIVVATVTTNTSTDAWLRIDGSNSLAADLGLGGFSITNVDELTANTIITDSIEATGDLTISGDMTIDGELTASSDFFSKKNLTIGDRTLSPSSTNSPVVKFEYPGSSSNEDIRIENYENTKVRVTNDQGNAEFSADRLYLGDIDRYAQEGIYTTTIVQDGDYIYPPTCPTNMTAQIFVSVSSLYLDPYSAIGGFNSYAAIDSGGWRARVDVRTSAGVITSGNSAINARLEVKTKCLLISS